MTAQLSPVPVAKFFDNNGAPLAFGLLTTYAAGTTTAQATYVDSTQTTQNNNPIQLNFRGECNLWLDPTKTYKFLLQDSQGNTIPGWPVDNIPGSSFVSASGSITIPANLIPTPTNTETLGTPSFSWAQIYLGANAAPAYDPVSGNIGYYARTAAEISAGVTPTNYAYSPVGPIDIRRYTNSIVLDGTTDNTTAISAVLTALATFRGMIYVPYNCKYTKSTVNQNLPVGIVLVDDSSVNVGQPPGYKRKVRRTYCNDSVSDDSSTEFESSHHPAIRLNNLHTAGTSSATGAYHSIIRSYGFRWNNDSIDGMQWLTFQSPRGTLWRTADIQNTSLDFAKNAANHWITGTGYTNGVSRVNTSDSGVWIATSTGTSGATEPNGTGPTFNDGGVTWSYQGLWSASRTVVYWDEDGYGAVAGVTTARWGAETANRKGISINSNDTTHDVWIADDQKAVDLWRLSDASGLQPGGIQSLNYSGAISGATPTLSGSMHTVNNVGATNMTNILLPGSQTRGYVVLLFTNGNTTVKASGFNLKGGVDVTPAANNIMTFFKEPSISGSWTEISRNF